MGSRSNNEINRKLITAIIDKNTEMVQMLLETGADVNCVAKLGPRQWDWTPVLILAIKYSLDEIVNMLLEKGADIDRTDSNGDNALFWAVRGQNKEIVRMLLGKGAGTNIALFIAVRDSCDKIIDMLSNYVSKQTLNNALLRTKYISTVNALVNSGADLNYYDDSYETLYNKASDSLKNSLVQKYEDLDTTSSAMRKKIIYNMALRKTPLSFDMRDTVVKYLFGHRLGLKKRSNKKSKKRSKRLRS